MTTVHVSQWTTLPDPSMEPTISVYRTSRILGLSIRATYALRTRGNPAPPRRSLDPCAHRTIPPQIPARRRRHSLNPGDYRSDGGPVTRRNGSPIHTVSPD